MFSIKIWSVVSFTLNSSLTNILVRNRFGPEPKYFDLDLKVKLWKQFDTITLNSSLISPPEQWTVTRTLTEADSKSIWGRLYQNKMDETGASFFGMKDGLEHILNEPKVAFLNSGDFIRYFSDYHCKVCITIVHFCTVSKVIYITLFFTIMNIFSCIGSKVPFCQNWKIAKMALLNPCMKFKFVLPNDFFCSIMKMTFKKNITSSRVRQIQDLGQLT